MIRSFARRHFTDICLMTAVVLINLSLGYGAGVDLGWWWVMFWVGLAFLYAGLRADINDTEDDGV